MANYRKSSMTEDERNGLMHYAERESESPCYRNIDPIFGLRKTPIDLVPKSERIKMKEDQI